MAQKTEKYYVVWQGKKPGIYRTWDDCKKQVNGVAGAKYKSYPSKEQAEAAYKQEPPNWLRKKAEGGSKVAKSKGIVKAAAGGSPKLPALAVDAACSGNPGRMEFRGMMVMESEGTTDAPYIASEAFHRGPFEKGTNNIGEFLAIVLGLAFLEHNKLDWHIYSDSKTAMAWIRGGKVKTTLKRSKANEAIFQMIEHAEEWLKTHRYTTAIYKWDTDNWGEIPADFGRK